MLKYADYIDVFSYDLGIEFPKNTRINEYSIKLKKSKQPLYKPIYNLELVELETFKTYFETDLKPGFIQLSKSPSSAPILFDKKLNGNLCLCVDY